MVLSWRHPVPGYDLKLSTSLQRFGSGDPTSRRGHQAFVRAFWSPEGACTLALRQNGSEIEAELVGAGATWVRERLPEMFNFLPQELPWNCPHPGLRQLARRLAGLRVGPFPWVFETVQSIVLQQRVAFEDASASFRRLVMRYGQSAPGPLSLKLPLSPEQWLTVGLNRIQEMEVDPKRAQTLLRVAELGLNPEPTRLAATRGIGPWTLQSVMGFGWGNPDAVPIGDLHLPRVVAEFFGHRPGGDERMLELLDPYRGLRFRVIQWIMAAAHARAF
ncbi:hypothetical protein JST97_17285 [bacterium]|nr:hypothetical protein [bacterium]